MGRWLWWITCPICCQTTHGQVVLRLNDPQIRHLETAMVSGLILGFTVALMLGMLITKHLLQITKLPRWAISLIALLLAIMLFYSPVFASRNPIICFLAYLTLPVVTRIAVLVWSRLNADGSTHSDDRFRRD